MPCRTETVSDQDLNMPFAHKLRPAECKRLLRAGSFGRVAFAGPDGPEILPVNYLVAGDEIRIRTDWESVLAYADRAALALEVDHHEPESRNGWSVVARGTGQLVDIREISGYLPRPWANGDGRAILRLRWEQLTGRRIGESLGTVHHVRSSSA